MPLDPIPPPERFLVRIIGNIIIGNENPSHNSGAARITMQSRAELRGNVIARNDTGLYLQTSAVEARNNTVVEPLLLVNDSKASRELPGPTVLANNIFWGKPDIRMEADISHCDIRGGHDGKASIDKDPMFADDGWSGTAASLRRDPTRALTSLQVSLPSDPGSVEGRAIRIGNFWTVIRDAGRVGVTVWGVVPEELGPGPVRIEIVPSYRLKPESPCRGAGENGANIGALQ
jgi:hypothetical protein